jgi:hypothetical protein
MMTLAKSNPFLIREPDPRTENTGDTPPVPIRVGGKKVEVDVSALRHLIEIVRAKLQPSRKHLDN